MFECLEEITRKQAFAELGRLISEFGKLDELFKEIELLGKLDGEGLEDVFKKMGHVYVELLGNAYNAVHKLRTIRDLAQLLFLSQKNPNLILYRGKMDGKQAYLLAGKKPINVSSDGLEKQLYI